MLLQFVGTKAHDNSMSFTESTFGPYLPLMCAVLKEFMGIFSKSIQYLYGGRISAIIVHNWKFKEQVILISKNARWRRQLEDICYGNSKV